MRDAHFIVISKADYDRVRPWLADGFLKKQSNTEAIDGKARAAGELVNKYRLLDKADEEEVVN